MGVSFCWLGAAMMKLRFFLICAALTVSAFMGVGSALALVPPTPQQLAEYQADGTMQERVAAAEAIGNDVVDPALLSSLRDRALAAQGYATLPAPPPGRQTGSRLSAHPRSSRCASISPTIRRPSPAQPSRLGSMVRRTSRILRTPSKACVPSTSVLPTASWTCARRPMVGIDRRCPALRLLQQPPAEKNLSPTHFATTTRRVPTSLSTTTTGTERSTT